MQNHYSQIRFMAANYSRLQGLRAVPAGILSVFVSVWSLSNHGPRAKLSEPVLVALLAILLYWLIDRYYNQAFGRIKQTPRQRTWEIIMSVSGSALTLLAFLFDTTETLSISVLGLVLATCFLEYFWRVNKSEWKKILTLYPENIVAAVLITIISLLPLFGISWWHSLGIQSQIVGVFLIFGIFIVVTGLWGHARMVRTLSALKMKQADNPKGG